MLFLFFFLSSAPEIQRTCLCAFPQTPSRLACLHHFAWDLCGWCISDILLNEGFWKLEQNRTYCIFLHMTIICSFPVDAFKRRENEKCGSVVASSCAETDSTHARSWDVFTRTSLCICLLCRATTNNSPRRYFLRSTFVDPILGNTEKAAITIFLSHLV